MKLGLALRSFSHQCYCHNLSSRHSGISTAGSVQSPDAYIQIPRFEHIAEHRLLRQEQDTGKANALAISHTKESRLVRFMTKGTDCRYRHRE